MNAHPVSRIQNPKSLPAVENKWQAGKIQNDRSLRLSRGQALLELAIFGATIVMLLGVMLNYGLNTDFTQSSMMQTFRKALQAAGFTETGSVLVMQDRHIPSPSDPFGKGTMLPIAMSDSVTRNYEMHLTADWGREEELPKTQMFINGKPIDCNPNAPGKACTNAGFRQETGAGVMGWKLRDGGDASNLADWINDPDHVGMIDRYEEIYGASNVWLAAIDPNAGPCVESHSVCTLWSAYSVSYSCTGCVAEGCIPPCCRSTCSTDPSCEFGCSTVLQCLPYLNVGTTGCNYNNGTCTYGCRRCIAFETVCDRHAGETTVRIIDSCEGELISWEACVRQARMIVDSYVCEQECDRGRRTGGSYDDSCEAICQQPMNQPWYTENAQEIDPATNQWTFPNLNTVFAAINAMGPQPGTTTTSTIASALHKEETATNITTTDRVNWREETIRDVVYKPWDDPANTTDEVLTPNRMRVNTSVCEDVTCSETTQRNWTSPW